MGASNKHPPTGRWNLGGTLILKRISGSKVLLSKPFELLVIYLDKKKKTGMLTAIWLI